LIPATSFRHARSHIAGFRSRCHERAHHAPRASQLRRHRDGSVWPKRRMWQDRVASDKRFTHGPRASSAHGLPLGRRGKPSGAPSPYRHRLGRSERSVRRYVAEAEQLGYLKVYRYKAERGPEGAARKKTNVYYLCLPKVGDDARPQAPPAAPVLRDRQPQRGRPGAGSPAGQEASGGDQTTRRQRAGAELVAVAGVPSHLQDSDDPQPP